MNEMVKFRCSELPRLFRCTHSKVVDGDALVVEHSNEAGDAGTAAHEVLRRYYSEDFQASVAENICAAHGVDQGAVWPLVNVAKKIVADLGLGRPDSMEDEIDDGTLSGHPDAEWTTAGYYWIGDWKSSRLDPDYYHQLMGYAWLRRERIRGLKGCHLFVAWLRDATVERYFVDIDAIEQWGKDFLGIAVKASAQSGPFVTGEHCGFCPRASTCQAQREDMRRALAVVDGDVAAVDVSKLDGQTVARVHRKLKMLASLKEAWDEAIKARIRATGPIDCGDGSALAVVTEKGKREIDTAAAWPVLQKHLDYDEMAACVVIRVGAVEDAVAKKAPPRKGAAAVRALADELTSAGAIRQGTVDKLKEIRNKNLPAKENTK